ncbi:ribonuclease H-like domain-containing protein [Paenibacillus sp. 32O-W]|nr:ribonuclease H-like domain-containing protein [Paenibacillus sp. 32O-W]
MSSAPAIDREGQMLLFPEIEVNVYWTSLTCSPWRVIELYRDHGTSEQFHSELKTDLDLERLPAGKFDTNDLVLHAGVFAYNLLRIRTVIQNIVYIAARVSRHARQTIFNIGRYSPWFQTVRRVYQAFA